MISNKNILEHDIRQKIYRFILENSGLHLREISRRMAIPKSTLRHHLKYLNKHYNENITLDQAIKLAFNSIKKVFKRKINIECIEVGIIDRNKAFYKLNKSKIQKMI